MAPQRIRLFMPVYNAESTVTATLRAFVDLHTLVQQRGRELEVLVIDDASVDGTSEVLDDFAADHPFLDIKIRPARLGNTAAVIDGYNWGLTEARNDDIVGCCDADGEHNPLAFLRHIDLLEDFDGVVGSINYPTHIVDPDDLNMMRFLGGLQGKACADGPFYVQSPGWQLHHGEYLWRVITDVFPAYCSYYNEVTRGSLPPWGLHGVIDLLLAAIGARLHAVYLECYGYVPNRTPTRLAEQASATLRHLELVKQFATFHLPGR